jgi:hypothetical protein
MPAAQVFERQPLALGFSDLLSYPGKRSLVILSGFSGINHRLISSGVLPQGAD